MPGCRFSDFFCLVNLPVADSMESMMSLATLRGRLVIRLLPVVGEDDRGFAPVGELDAGVRQVQGADDGLASVGADLRQGAFEPLAGSPERAERIGDRGAPVGAGHDLAGNRAACRQSGLMQPEGELDDVRDILVEALALRILERLGNAPGTHKQPLQLTSSADAEW